MIDQYLIGDIDFFALHDGFTDPLEYFIGKRLANAQSLHGDLRQQIVSRYPSNRVAVKIGPFGEFFVISRVNIHDRSGFIPFHPFKHFEFLRSRPRQNQDLIAFFILVEHDEVVPSLLVDEAVVDEIQHASVIDRRRQAYVIRDIHGIKRLEARRLRDSP